MARNKDIPGDARNPGISYWKKRKSACCIEQVLKLRKSTNFNISHRPRKIKKILKTRKYWDIQGHLANIKVGKSCANFT